MHNFSINIDSAKSCYLKHIRNETFYSVVNANGSQKLFESEGRSYLEVSVDENFRERVGLNLRSAIADVISMGFKTDYLGKKLAFSEDSLVNRVLVDTMSIFDSSTDRKITYGAINNLDNLSIDGLFTFRLGKLRVRWGEIAAVTESNGLIFYDDESKVGFLSYLIMSVPSVCREITLDMNLHQPVFYDSNGTTVDCVSLLKVGTVSPEEELMFNLVNLAPKKLTVTGDRELLSREFLELSDALFGGDQTN